MSDKQHIIFTYGCPRTGTTFAQHLLNRRREGYFFAKIGEGCPPHPMNSADGLTHIRGLFTLQPVNIFFVRIVRNPIDIFKSFHAARKAAARGASDSCGRLGAGKIARRPDDTILSMILNERKNTEKQRGYAVDKKGRYSVDIIDLNYDKLNDSTYVESILKKIAEKLPDPKNQFNRLKTTFDEMWNKDFVREGAKSHGITDIILPDETLEKIKKAGL